MAIPTSRAKDPATISVDHDLCKVCGLCVSVCSDLSLKIENKKIVKSDTAIFGCIGCGHCMAVCPSGAIKIHGREISPDDVFNLPGNETAADYNQILSLYQRRRSVRKFKDKNVEPEIIEKILTAAKTAPMGLPPSDVHVMILNGKDKTRAFAEDFCAYMETMKWFVSAWFLALMRPFWGKANDEMFKGFVKPLFKVYPEKMRENINVVNYDAPLAMYFYGSPYTDPADPVIAATYAMLAAESLGLGTCMLGAVHPLIQNGKKARLFRERHGIKFTSREGLFVIFGYPAVQFRKGINRSFADVSSY
jgi:ferredoxin